jgi:chorismate lyase / 3-hydroxybenzoate synthase
MKSITINISPDVSDSANALGHMVMGQKSLNTPIGGQQLAALIIEPAAAQLVEQWISNHTVHRWHDDTVSVAQDGQLLMGAIQVDAVEPIDSAAQRAYEKLFEVLDRCEYPFLWRAWNYIPNINQNDNGIERYQLFNSGRQQGFAARRRATEGHVPAACALGTAYGPLSIGFLAGRTQTIPIENPRQVSAFHYPKQYGAKAPTFARAALAQLPGQELFLLSGTASIMGHQTLHLGDVVAQTQETLRNIDAVLEQGNRQRTRTEPYVLEDFHLRVYVRHVTDYPSIARVLKVRLGPNATRIPIYLQMDICRSDLLVEIEGTAC